MCSSAFYPLLSFFWANIQQENWQGATKNGDTFYISYLFRYKEYAFIGVIGISLQSDWHNGEKQATVERDLPKLKMFYFWLILIRIEGNSRGGK